jgi:hypothetical protein
MNSNPLVLNNGIPSTLPLSGSSAFAIYQSNIVNTQSSVITSTSFTTFSNSPAFTFTPTISGTYKVYCSIPLENASVNTNAQARIFNTSGGATLLAESQVAINSGTAAFITEYAQSVYTLTAGTTYVFDIQALDQNSSGVSNRGDSAQFYMFAEGVGLQGSFATAFASYVSSPISTISSGVTSVAPTYTTFSNSPGFTFTPTVSGIYKIYCPAAILQNTANKIGLAQIFCSSGSPVLLSQSTAGTLNNAGSILDTLLVQSTYTLTAGNSYTFDIQGANNSSGGVVQLDGADVPSFFMYAEGVGLTGPVQLGMTATQSTNLSITGGSPIIFNTQRFAAGITYNNTTGQATVADSGQYLVGINGVNFTDSTQRIIYIYINGIQYNWLSITNSAGLIFNSSTLLTLSANDVVTIVSDVSGTLTAASFQQAEFYIKH